MTHTSPRSIAPAAFSVGEAITGGALTLAAYLVVSLPWYTLATWASDLVSMGEISTAWWWALLVWEYGAITAVPAVIVGTITASLIGRAMRGHASFPRHLIAQGVHAYVIGAIATLVFLLVVSGGGEILPLLAYPLLWGGPAAAIAALVGWRSTIAIARRRDRTRAARG